MKTACIYHSIDLDGWMSAAIIKHWFIQNSDKIRIYNDSDQSEIIEYITNPNPNDDKTLVFIGYDYGQKYPELSEYDWVIMCDVSFSPEKMLELNKKLTWIDHHISAINDSHNYNYEMTTLGIRSINFSACELTWLSFFPNETMPEIVRLLGRYDCFGGYKTDEWQKILEFQFGERSLISNYEEAYQQLILSFKDIESKILESGKAIYKYLCIEAKETYKNGFEIEFDRLGSEIEGWLGEKYKFICINKERFNPINFGIDYHKDGYDGCACFHYANGMWNFSLYNENGDVDCTQIAKQFGGGGHAGASGFKLNNEKFFKIITKNFV